MVGLGGDGDLVGLGWRFGWVGDYVLLGFWLGWIFGWVGLDCAGSEIWLDLAVMGWAGDLVGFGDLLGLEN